VVVFITFASTRDFLWYPRYVRLPPREHPFREATFPYLIHGLMSAERRSGRGASSSSNIRVAHVAYPETFRKGIYLG